MKKIILCLLLLCSIGASAQFVSAVSMTAIVPFLQDQAITEATDLIQQTFPGVVGYDIESSAQETIVAGVLPDGSQTGSVTITYSPCPDNCDYELTGPCPPNCD
jgi:hypothetical protein